MYERRMEENEKQTKQEMGRPRAKKKGTLTKLKERKEREFSSTSSLQKYTYADDNNVPIGAEEKPVHSQVNINGSSKPEFYHFSTKDPRNFSVAKETSQNDIVKPQPKPRSAQKKPSTSSNQTVKSCSEKETDSNCINKEIPSAETESFDQTLNASQQRHIFKSKGKSDSVESVTSGGFTPKPPVTPRSSRSTPRTPRGYIPFGKAEKTVQEKYPIGNESDLDNEINRKEEKEDNIKHKNDVSDLIVDEMESKSVRKNGSARDTASFQKENKKLLTRRGSIHNDGDVDSFKSQVKDSSDRTKEAHSLNNYNGNPVLSASSLRDESPQRLSLFKSRRRSGSCSPSRVLPDKFKPPSSPSSSQYSGDCGGSGSHINNSDPHLPFRANPSSSETAPVNSHMQYTSNDNSWSISTPPTSGRLEPVRPRSQPPPLPRDFTSNSLKTSYKIDPNVRPHTSSGVQRIDGDRSDSGTTSGADKVSQKSFSSGSVLPIITTKEARSRSYLEGSVSSASPSMLGSEELERYFPDRRVNVLVGTWNLNELKEITIPLDDFILPEKCDYVQDIYAIGTQENYINKKEWEIKLQETLGPSHVMFHSVSLGALHLIIFVRRDLIWFCSLPEEDAISLRAVTMVKTKGAIGISFTMFGSSFLFINCHLTSDRDNENSRKKHRMGDYFKVIQEMNFKLIQESKQAKVSNSSSGKKRVDITAFYDCVFWCGDLNFRIERQRHAVEGKVNQITSEEVPNFEALLGGDQLLKFMTEGKIFNGFQEGRINFHPTFKFDVSKDTYDSSVKNRVPSYTDRVMFRSKKKNDITCLHYEAVMELKVSDHRPVFGQFAAGIKPGRDNMVYGAGHFDRTVYMEANQRRAANQLTTQKKMKTSSICSIQ